MGNIDEELAALIGDLMEGKVPPLSKRDELAIYFDVEGTLIRGPERAHQMLELARKKGFKTIIWTGGYPDDYYRDFPDDTVHFKDFENNRHIWMAVDDNPLEVRKVADIVIDVWDKDALDVFRHALEQKEKELKKDK